MPDGQFKRIRAPTDLDKQEGVAAVFTEAIAPTGEFRAWYVRRRLALAKGEAGDATKHIAVELRRALSICRGAPSNPKLEALRRWARRRFIDDLGATLKDGVPRKLVVFSHLKTDVVGPIEVALRQELIAAHGELGGTPAWRAARKSAAAALDDLLAAIEPYLSARKRAGKKIARQLTAFRRATEGSLFFDLLGRRPFAKRVPRSCWTSSAPTNRRRTVGVAKTRSSTLMPGSRTRFARGGALRWRYWSRSPGRHSPRRLPGTTRAVSAI